MRTAACLGLLIAVAAAGQTARDRKAIAHTKTILVSQLDPKLPSIPFERWLIKEAGEGAQISWEVNDCGEQTGSPENQGSDFPMCVEADAHMRDKRVIVVSIAVGRRLWPIARAVPTQALSARQRASKRRFFRCAMLTPLGVLARSHAVSKERG